MISVEHAPASAIWQVANWSKSSSFLATPPSKLPSVTWGVNRSCATRSTMLLTWRTLDRRPPRGLLANVAGHIGGSGVVRPGALRLAQADIAGLIGLKCRL